jgi:hypothetical protein
MGTHDKTLPRPRDIMFGRSRRDFESEPGSIPVGGDCGDRIGIGVLAAGEPAVLFLPANTVRELVGISVGIGSHRRRKLLQIQIVMELGDYRPGAPFSQ